MFFPARPLVNSSEGQAIPPEFFPSALKVLPFVHVWKVLMSTITFLPSLLFGTPSPCLCLETPVRTQLTSVPANPWPLPPLRPPRLFLAKYTPCASSKSRAITHEFLQGASPGPSHSSVPARVLINSHQSVLLCASRRVPKRTSSGSKCPHLSRDRLTCLPRATCSRTDNSCGAPPESAEVDCAQLPVCALRLHRPPSSQTPRKFQWSAPTLYRSVVISRTLTCSCRRPPPH